MSDEPRKVFGNAIPGGPARGALLGRALRYAAACFAGYLFGLAAGHAVTDGPGVIVLAVLGLVALYLVFRQGAKSQSHAAADAIGAANARATAVAAAHAQASQVVTVNALNGTLPVTSNEQPSVSASLTHNSPQSLEQSRHVDIWSDEYEMPGEQVVRRRLHP
jgi:hypothetical protein